MFRVWFPVLLVSCAISHDKSEATRTSMPVASPESPVGPPYPVTASWFRDRFTRQEWDDTLKGFKKQGGDTVFLRAPPVVKRTSEELQHDPNFLWCGSYNSSTGTGLPYCWDQAEQELKSMGLNVTAFLTYQYEEAFSDAIMLCPKVDRKIRSSRNYYRIVLPANTTALNTRTSCDFPPGSNVVVLFTSFAGTDPHQLLLQSAANLSVSVFFSLPGAPVGFEEQLMPAYYAWLERVLLEHKARYTQMYLRDNYGNSGPAKSLYDSLTGYYGTDECSLPEIAPGSDFIPVHSKTSPQLIYIPLYTKMGTLVRSMGKRFAISPYVNLNRFQLNSTVQAHVQGFEAIVKTGVVDIIAVQEGRGAGRGCYYWPHELHQPVRATDPTLDKSIHYLNPQIPSNVSFAQAFTASNQVVFRAFQKAQQKLIEQENIDFEFWLNLEAFEYLRDDPCLPVDPMASGMGELLNRAAKARVDRGLSVAGAFVQKVISFAWDADYTCTTHQYSKSLQEEILTDLNRPIIANCSFHSPHNLSVVLLGFNLEAETQSFTVDWTDTRGRSQSTNIYGYYFELDYGAQHNLVKSLEYTMLWDIPQMVTSLAPTGTVHVSGHKALDDCYFDYDLPYDEA
ncbi:uncharacterized protein LOC106011351 [Aplysia californica]|uniref:Uncharacterized protein LOC106011351 n=1 Tax=Aplysia californica TaxID=6500 RepID=A0ABM0ZWR9_APLCA|nr:uncharacterized protein LOC106011351 [Aplysia californica]